MRAFVSSSTDLLLSTLSTPDAVDDVGVADTAGPNVFTRARARSIGLPVRKLLGGEFNRLFYDTYVPSADGLALRTRAAAVLRRVPTASHISHHTAVRLWGGIAPESPQIHVSMSSREARCRRNGVAAHLANQNARTTVRDGIRVSTPIQAFLDLASIGVTLIDLIITGDSLAKAAGLEPSNLIEAAEAWRGRNARLARKAASLVRKGVDSAMESRLRLLIIFAGLPEPDVNIVLRDVDGNWWRRFDLCYRHCKLVVEYDGRQHAYDDDQWLNDLDRREQLDRMGWRLIVVQANGIYNDPLRTLQRIRTALEECGATVSKRFNPEWTRHFAVRS